MRSLFCVVISIYGYSADQSSDAQNDGPGIFETANGKFAIPVFGGSTVPTTSVTSTTTEVPEPITLPAHPTSHPDETVKCDWPPNEAMEVADKVQSLTEDCSELTGMVMIEGRIRASTYDKLKLITRLNGSLTIGCSDKAMKVLGQFANLKTIENNVPELPALTICYTKKKQQEIKEIDKFRRRVRLICTASTQNNCFKEKGWIDGVNAFVRSLVLARRLPGRTEPSGELSNDYKILKEYLHGIFIFSSIVCLLLSTCSIFIIIYCLQLHKSRHARKSRVQLHRLKIRNNSEVAERELHPLEHYCQAAVSQKSNEDLLIHATPPTASQPLKELTAREHSASSKSN